MESYKKHRLAIAGIVGVIVFVTLFVLSSTSQTLVGRLLEGDELLRVQAEADFNADGMIDFRDFTFFSALYEG